MKIFNKFKKPKAATVKQVAEILGHNPKLTTSLKYFKSFGIKRKEQSKNKDCVDKLTCLFFLFAGSILVTSCSILNINTSSTKKIKQLYKPKLYASYQIRDTQDNASKLKSYSLFLDVKKSTNNGGFSLQEYRLNTVNTTKSGEVVFTRGNENCLTFISKGLQQATDTSYFIIQHITRKKLDGVYYKSVSSNNSITIKFKKQKRL